MGTLYLVATPIGNLEDISARALRILGEAALIAAEDTRHTRKLLARYDIERPLVAYHEHNKLARLDTLLLTLAEGNDIALVSDAGTPAISDPGYELVRTVIEAGFPVVPIPGPCAAIAALSVAGLPTDRFLFLGFPPRKSAERRRWFEEVADVRATLVLYESPHRVAATLEDALAVFGEREAAVARELTKLHEQVVRGTLGAVGRTMATSAVRGEVVLLIAGAPSKRALRNQARQAAESDEPGEIAPPVVDEAAARAALEALRAAGWQGTKAAKQIAREYNLDRGRVYQWWIDAAEEA